jgi:hypothetical protein
MEHCEALERELTHEGPSEELHARVRGLLAADAKWLEAAKLLVASGVRQFEVHEADVLDKGAEELLGALRGLPRITREHLGSVAEGDALSAPAQAG